MTEKSLEDLYALMNKIDGKIDGLQQTTNGLSTRIEEVNTATTDAIRILKARIINNHQDVNVKIERVSNTVDENKQSVNDELAQVKTNLQQHEKRLDDQDVALRDAQTLLAAANKRNNFQAMRLKELEKACYGGLQHGRGWNLEIVGIPANVGDEPGQLQSATLKILHAINVQCQEGDIDSIHRLPSSREGVNKSTIVRFHSRKLVRRIHENKHILRDIGELNIDIPGINAESKIYLQASQCPYVKTLAYNCRVLKRNRLISNIITGKDGRITIKTLGDEFVKITHASDLVDMFPLFREFNFTRINYDDE